MLREFILQNWALILIAIAFAILLKTTVFLERRAILRMYVLIALVVLFSVAVFLEFNLRDPYMSKEMRAVFMAVRYSMTPFIIAMILYTLARRARWFVFAPAAALVAVNVISIFTGVVFRVVDADTFRRGPLGYLPFIAAGLYSIALVYTLYRQCNKQASEIIPIVFLSLAFLSGLILPFVLGGDYSKIFCTTIIIALFIYYVFSILQLTSKDALTGLLNRQAYYVAVREFAKDITGLVSIDMNGLKVINDNEGHTAGDEALTTLALCFMHAKKGNQSVYRIGGDEFVVVCRRSSEEEIRQLIERIRCHLAKTPYSCAIGYSYAAEGVKAIDDMLKDSDKMMYADKADFYRNSGLQNRSI